MPEHNLIAQLWTTRDAGKTLGVAPHRFRILATDKGFRSMNGMWDADAVQAIATNLLLTGSPHERAKAREALSSGIR